MYRRLLVAVDGSEQSYKVLDQAVAIAEKFDSELILLTVIPTMITPFLSDESFDLTTYTKFQERTNELYHNKLKDAYGIVSSKHPKLIFVPFLERADPQLP